MKAPATVAVFLVIFSSLAPAQSMMKSSTGAGGAGSMMLPSAEASGAEARTAPGSGRRVPYTDLDAAKALAARGPTLLFFFADWCPTCQAAMRDIDENGSRLADITLVVVDYDRERDLARRYQVTYQHTFVQIDAAGARLAAWNGGGVEAILARVERAAAD